MSLGLAHERLLELGTALGAPSIAWGSRDPHPPPIALTDRDQRLLTTLYDFNYMTTTMLSLLFWGRIGTTAAARLKLLHDHGYIEKFRPRVRRSQGSREWIYRITERAWHDVVSHHQPETGEKFQPAELTSISYVEHDLQLNALILHIGLLAAAAHGWAGRGPLLDHVPFQLWGPRAGTIRLPSASTSQTLAPDATLVGTDQHGRSTAVLIEYDRTRRAHRQIEKLKRYDHFLAKAWRTTQHASLDIEPLVLFVCANEAQLPSFLRIADKHLIARCGPGPDRSTEGCYSGREQIAFTTRSRLLTQDWRLAQVSPSVARASRGSRQPLVDVDLPLPYLFTA